MKKKLLGVMVALLVLFAVAAQATAAKKVLVVESYHQDFEWCQSIDNTIGKVLKPAGIQYKYFYMDTKRKSSRQWKEEVGRLVEEEVKSYEPDVVITVDDNAQNFFAKKYVGNDQVQIIFNGVNADADKYGFPASNVSGILERTYADQSLGLLAMIVKGLKKVAYLSDDSATSSIVTPRVQDAAKNGKMPVELVGWERPSTFAEWQQAVQKYDADSSVGGFLIPLYHTVKKEDGSAMTASDVMAWTVANTEKPVAGLWPFSTHDGALCAVVVDPVEHGRVAAEMALKVIKGKKAGELPIVVNEQGYVIINIKTAKKLNLMMPFNLITNANEVIE